MHNSFGCSAGIRQADGNRRAAQSKAQPECIHSGRRCLPLLQYYNPIRYKSVAAAGGFRPEDGLTGQTFVAGSPAILNRGITRKQCGSSCREERSIAQGETLGKRSTERLPPRRGGVNPLRGRWIQ